MAVPDYQAMMLPLLTQFAEGKTRVADCLPALRKEFAVSDDEAAVLLPSSAHVTLISNRANWARSYLGKAGLLRSPKRGHHEITELGLKFLATKPTELSNKILEQFPAFVEWRQEGKKGPTDLELMPATDGFVQDQTPEDIIESAYNTLNTALRDELLSILYELNPVRFERLILDLLTAMGYGKGDLANKAFRVKLGSPKAA